MTIPEYITLLRTTKHEQCFGRYIDGEKCCGMGIVIKTMATSGTYPFTPPFLYFKIFSRLDADLHKIGIDVQRLNDGDAEGKGRLTFVQIADAVEAAYIKKETK